MNFALSNGVCLSLLALLVGVADVQSARGDALRNVALKVVADWQVEISITAAGATGVAQTARLDIPPADIVTVTAEQRVLPPFNAQAAGWKKGAPLQGLVAQECTSRDLLDPGSLAVRSSATVDAETLNRDVDYSADLSWGTVGRLPNGRISETKPVYLSYRYSPLRIDSIVHASDGSLQVRKGKPHAAAPLAPELQSGERRLANIWIAGRLTKLTEDNLFPILETAFLESASSNPSPAAKLLPNTLRKLGSGEPLRILAWGDSVTVGSFVPEPEKNRWQEQFVTRLRQRFPQAKIELVTEAWGGRNTKAYLAEPPGSEHNFQEKVLGAKADLIVSEFVNDASLKPAEVVERYGKLRADFRAVGAEWIILTPHYTRPDWMGLTRQRDVDGDPRPYVTALREFAPANNVALADASRRWGRLWRQGIPYQTLLLNAINHPDERGMALFADSLMALFP